MPPRETGRGAKDDLKRREYRDEKGQVHHHTRPYMERHGEGGAKGEERSFQPKARAVKSAKSRGGRKGGGAETTTNHHEIRQWAERHGGRPAAVERTHSDDDVGIIRIMFPDAPNSEHGALTEISWEEFFEEFEARKLALLYDPDSLFSKIIGRDTAEKRARGEGKAAR